MFTINQLDEVHIRVEAEPGYLYELADRFSFQVPGYRFMPAYKSGIWDGKISMVDRRGGMSYFGLIDEIKQFCTEREYPIKFKNLFEKPTFSRKDIDEFIKGLNIPEDKQPRDYQMDSIYHALEEQKAIVVSPTGSGKSLAIYMLARFMQQLGLKLIIVVPTVNLVSQLFSDFDEYAVNETNWSSEKYVHKIFSGQDKVTDKPIVISTWQSLQRVKKEYFGQYEAFICDEVHKAEARVLSGYINEMLVSKFRIGLTGTLNESIISDVQLKALFGPVKQVATTKELMDRGILAKLKIRIIQLNYPEHIASKVRGLPYKDEIDFIVQYGPRNSFIKNLAVHAPGNTLLLFRYIDKQGKPLHKMISEAKHDKEVYYVSGSVEAEAREAIRKLTEASNSVIITASFGVFSLGVNIVNLNNLILASPVKAKIALLQSIGRALRTNSQKDAALLIDFVDNFPNKKGKTGKNYAMKHFHERFDIYMKEGFDVEFVEVNLA